MEPISVDPVSIRPFAFNRPRTNQEPYYSTDPITTIFFFLFPIFFDIFLSKFETDAFLNSSFLVQWTLLVVDVNILRIESRRLFFFFIILLTGGREQYVFTDLANKYIFTTVDYGATVQSYPLLFTPDEIIFDEREPLSLLVNRKQQQRDRALPSFQLQFDPVSSTSSFTFLLLEPKSIRFGFSW